MQKMKPMLCNTQVVQNILAGRQTQDRRPMGNKLLDKMLVAFLAGECSDFAGNGCLQKNDESYIVQFAKYQVGDVIYVRETFCIGAICEEEVCGYPGNLYVDQCKGDDSFIPKEYTIANGICTEEVTWKPSIHMKKKAARIFLKVTKVRCERFCDISEADAIAEGMEEIGEQKFHGTIWKPLYKSYDSEVTCCSAVDAFSTLIESIYPGCWEDWCFAYDFKLCEKPEGESCTL